MSSPQPLAAEKKRLSGRVASVQVSDGGVPKRPVPDPVRITRNGVAGDRQRNLKHHGGPDRAVCLYSADMLEALQDEGHPIFAGAAGENLTVRGLDWSQVVPGARIEIGEAVLEITKPANPCTNLIPFFRDGDFSRISAMLHPGWARMYARVLQEGSVAAGEEVFLVVSSPEAPVTAV